MTDETKIVRDMEWHQQRVAIRLNVLINDLHITRHRLDEAIKECDAIKEENRK